MNISCDCGAFKANLTSFPTNTPGRLVCYCKDCQNFLNRIDRRDVLDDYGGTEVIPAYPQEIRFLQGQEELKCYRLNEHGLFRWATSCCNSPIANTRPGFPWVGIFHSAYKSHDPDALQCLGEIKSRIFGRDAAAGAPFNISNKLSFKDILTVMPFIVKGKFRKMSQGSPFFENDDKTPIRKPEILSEKIAQQ